MSHKTYCQWCTPTALHDESMQPVICGDCLRKLNPLPAPPALKPIDKKRGKS